MCVQMTNKQKQLVISGVCVQTTNKQEQLVISNMCVQMTNKQEVLEQLVIQKHVCADDKQAGTVGHTETVVYVCR